MKLRQFVTEKIFINDQRLRIVSGRGTIFEGYPVNLADDEKFILLNGEKIDAILDREVHFISTGFGLDYSNLHKCEIEINIFLQ